MAIGLLGLMAHAHSHVVVVHDKEQEHAATQHQQMVVYHALDQQLPPFHATKDHVQVSFTANVFLMLKCTILG